MDDVDRPAWAINLPERATLEYIRSLGATAAMVSIALWLTMVVIRDPRALRRIARKRVGA